MNSKILHAALFTLSPEGFWGLPTLLWSKPGIGKTSFIKSAAHRYNLQFERLSPAERGEGAFGVVPVPMPDGYLHYPAPQWAQKFISGGLVFLDEISSAAPALQAPLLGMVQLRTIGNHTFGPRTRIIAAGNDVQDGAGSWDLAPALSNRFGHFDFEGLTTTDWTSAILGGFHNEDTAVDAEVEERRVMDAWPLAIATARGLVAGFIRARPELLHKQPTRASNAVSRAWPSNRSVEYAVHALASARIHNLSEIDTDTFLAGFVGQGWVGEFATYRAHVDLPNVEDLLDGRITWKHDERRFDRTMAVLSSCAALVVPKDAARRDDRAKALWKLIGVVAKDAADVVLPAARALRYAQPTLIGPKVASTDTLTQLFPMFQASGIIGS